MYIADNEVAHLKVYSLDAHWDRSVGTARERCLRNEVTLSGVVDTHY